MANIRDLLNLQQLASAFPQLLRMSNSLIKEGEIADVIA
jgi:hypothetical protein